jgi:hypothetical protein
MKTIKTKETLTKLLEEKGNKLHIDHNGYKMCLPLSYITNENGDKIAMVEYYAYAGMLGLENHNKLMNGNDLELTLMELPTYVKRLERNKKIQKGIERNKRIKQAIEYFNGWQEGDNITITADFLNFAETLKGLL